MRDPWCPPLRTSRFPRPGRDPRQPIPRRRHRHSSPPPRAASCRARARAAAAARPRARRSARGARGIRARRAARAVRPDSDMIGGRCRALGCLARPRLNIFQACPMGTIATLTHGKYVEGRGAREGGGVRTLRERCAGQGKATRAFKDAAVPTSCRAGARIIRSASPARREACRPSWHGKVHLAGQWWVWWQH